MPAIVIEKFAGFIGAKKQGVFSTDIEAVKALDLQLMQAHRDELFLLNANPAMAGHFALQLYSTRDIAAIAYANRTRYIVLGGYLYQLAILIGAIGHSWAEMDQVIEVFGRDIFGQEVPATIQDLISQFFLGAGLSTDKKHRARKGKFMQLQPTVLAIMADNLSQGGINLPTLIRNVCTTRAQDIKTMKKTSRVENQEVERVWSKVKSSRRTPTLS